MSAEMLIRCMGANGKYAGYENMIACLESVCEDPKRLVSLERMVYKTVAEADGVSMNCLKRRLNILVTVLTKTAKRSQWLMLELDPDRKPTVGEFLEAGSWYLRQLEGKSLPIEDWLED